MKIVGNNRSILESIEDMLRKEAEGEKTKIDWVNLTSSERYEHERVAVGWIALVLALDGYVSNSNIGSLDLFWTRRIGFHNTPIKARIYRQGVKVSLFKKRIIYTVSVDYEGYSSGFSYTEKRVEIPAENFEETTTDVFKAVRKLYRAIKRFEAKTVEEPDVSPEDIDTGNIDGVENKQEEILVQTKEEMSQQPLEIMSPREKEV